MKVHESAEDYLETILILSQRQPSVRSIDIATELGYSKPSVSVAMKHLRENGNITVDDEGHIKLTPSGLTIAAKIYERHTIISQILEKMGVNPKIAAEDACRIEHVISTESFAAVKKYIKEHNLLENTVI